jgi:hypothetical protein
MNTTKNRSTVANRSRQILSVVRDDLRERRQASSTRRAIERDLASYVHRAEIDDILTLIADEPGHDAALVRGILNRNLHAQRPPIAS